MNPQTGSTLCGKYPKCLKKLFLLHAEFCVIHVSHDGIVGKTKLTWIVTAADCIRDPAGLFQIFDLRQVIQVDDGPRLPRGLIFGSRGFVRCKHDPLSADPGALCQ